MVANQIPEVFRGGHAGNGGQGRSGNGHGSGTGGGNRNASALAVAESDSGPLAERPWVQLPGSCDMVLDVPEQLLAEIVRTQAHATALRRERMRSGAEQPSYAIRTTLRVRCVPADGSEPSRAADLLMFISANDQGTVSYEGTYGLFRLVMKEVLDKHIARIAARGEAQDG